MFTCYYNAHAGIAFNAFLSIDVLCMGKRNREKVGAIDKLATFYHNYHTGIEGRHPFLWMYLVV
jgi:hypothetical protein